MLGMNENDESEEERGDVVDGEDAFGYEGGGEEDPEHEGEVAEDAFDEDLFYAFDTYLLWEDV
ncbi:hypothetical protein FIBSPDRAFT_861931, partial [Athelia psychrophila]